MNFKGIDHGIFQDVLMKFRNLFMGMNRILINI